MPRKSTRSRKVKGGNRHRITVTEVLKNSGAFNNNTRGRTKKNKKKLLQEIEKAIAKENKEQYKAE